MTPPKSHNILTITTRSNPCDDDLPIRKRKRAAIISANEQKAGQTSNPPQNLNTLMTPGLLMQFIKSNPSELTSLGFDGLLKLKTDKVPGSLSYCHQKVLCLVYLGIE
ncbi:hypothetical protein RND81_09G092400 [Saponaria officinalis]|uniref:Uncharacterized protein n=1 Tax=Saponaria officinalis TaxID=3572 RepID=A0AAW1IJI2_SAPOF